MLLHNYYIISFKKAVLQYCEEGIFFIRQPLVKQIFLFFISQTQSLKGSKSNLSFFFIFSLCYLRLSVEKNLRMLYLFQ